MSIVIITKNEEKLLPKLLKSIRKQTFLDYEIIVADANSSDNTKKIAELSGCKVVKGGLPAIGRNNGAKKTKGDMLLFLDSDVILHDRNFLKKSLKHFKRKKLGIQYNALLPISRKIIDHVMHFVSNQYLKIMQYIKPMGGGACIFVKKEIFDRVKGFDKNLMIGEDHNFIERCTKISKFRFCKYPVKISVRRFETDGRINIMYKYTMHTLYRWFTGREVTIKDKREVFQYHFNHK